MLSSGGRALRLQSLRSQNRSRRLPQRLVPRWTALRFRSRGSYSGLDSIATRSFSGLVPRERYR